MKSEEQDDGHGHHWVIDKINVDCSGFVRNVMESVMHQARRCLEDADFLRSKELFTYSTALMRGNKKIERGA
jgi:hypothetical protein